MVQEKQFAPLSKVCLPASVADPHHFDADPDSACYFDADLDSDPTLHFDADPDPDPSFQIKAQNLDKVLKQARFSIHFGSVAN
jgi:hypothetical protein